MTKKKENNEPALLGKKPITLDQFTKYVDKHNVACFFYIPGVGSGTIVRNKIELLVLSDIAKSKLHYLDMLAKQEAKTAIDTDIMMTIESVNKKKLDYVG